MESKVARLREHLVQVKEGYTQELVEEEAREGGGAQEESGAARATGKSRHVCTYCHGVTFLLFH